MLHPSGDTMPVQMEMSICNNSMRMKPALVQGTKKKAMLNTASNTPANPNVLRLPNRRLTGTATTTPIMLHTSPTARNRPAKKRKLMAPNSMLAFSPM